MSDRNAERLLHLRPHTDPSLTDAQKAARRHNVLAEVIHDAMAAGKPNRAIQKQFESDINDHYAKNRREYP